MKYQNQIEFSADATNIYDNNGMYIKTVYSEKEVTNIAGIIIPGIRIQGRNNNAFQFGFAGAFKNDETVPFPFPMFSWFKKL